MGYWLYSLQIFRIDNKKREGKGEGRRKRVDAAVDCIFPLLQGKTRERGCWGNFRKYQVKLPYWKEGKVGSDSQMENYTSPSPKVWLVTKTGMMTVKSKGRTPLAPIFSQDRGSIVYNYINCNWKEGTGSQDVQPSRAPFTHRPPIYTIDRGHFVTVTPRRKHVSRWQLTTDRSRAPLSALS